MTTDSGMPSRSAPTAMARPLPSDECCWRCPGRCRSACDASRPGGRYRCSRRCRRRRRPESRVPWRRIRPGYRPRPSGRRRPPRSGRRSLRHDGRHYAGRAERRTMRLPLPPPEPIRPAVPTGPLVMLSAILGLSCAVRSPSNRSCQCVVPPVVFVSSGCRSGSSIAWLPGQGGLRSPALPRRPGGCVW